MAGGSGGILEYIIRVRGGTAAAADVKRVAGSFNELGVAEERANVASKQGVAANAALSRAMRYTALAVVGIGFEALKSSVNFDAAMERIHTQAGASQASVDSMRQSVLAMSGTSTRYGPQQLAMALYHIVSTGQDGAKALRTLQAAADGAAMGNANLEDTASALAGVMKVGIGGAAKTAAGLMAQLNATVGTGNMTMDELTQALGQGVLPVAKNYGLTLQDITGALAVFTDEHIQGSSAMAQLATAFHFLTGSTKTSETALEGIGLTGAKLTADMRRHPHGLLIALADLRSHLLTAGDATQQTMVLNKILPGGRGRILQVLLNQLDNYNSKMTQASRITANYSQDIHATHETAANQLATAWARVQANLVKLGDSIKGWAVPDLVALTNALVPLMNGLGVVAKFIGAQPALMLTAVGAWATYRLAWALTVAKMRFSLITGFATTVAPAAASGTEAGAAYGEAASVGARGAMLRFGGWSSLGVVIGRLFAVAMIGEVAYALYSHFTKGTGLSTGPGDTLSQTQRSLVPVPDPHHVGRWMWVLPQGRGLGMTPPPVPQGGIRGGLSMMPPPLPRAVAPARVDLSGALGGLGPFIFKVDGQTLARAMHRQTQNDQARGG